MRPEVFLFMTALVLINIAGISIIYSKRAPNRIVASAFVFAFIAALFRLGARGAVWSLLGAVLTGAVALFFYRRNFIGAGDVKLLAVTGALLGPIQVFYALFIALCVLLSMDIASLTWQKRNTGKPLVASPLLMQAHAVSSPFIKMPCGVAIILGANLSYGIRHWLQ